MGTARSEIHVLDFATITREKLSGERYHIAEDDSFEYCFDSTPLHGFTNIGTGALFVRYKGGNKSPPGYDTKRGFVLPLTLDSVTEWSYTFEKLPPGILVVLVLPKGYTALDFTIRPLGVKSKDGSQLCFLFLEKPADLKFVLGGV